MKKLWWAISIVGLTIIGIIVYLIAFYIVPTQLNERTIDFEPRDLARINLKAYEHQEHIHSIEFKVTGQISGTAELTIGETDTTTYRIFKIVAGQVDIDYQGDWYSDNCFVTYKPTGLIDGELKIQYRFYGLTKY